MTAEKDLYQSVGAQSWSSFRSGAALLCSLGAFCACGFVPTWWQNRIVRKAYRQFCKGDVLDLSPKPFYASYLQMYEASRSVSRVNYIVTSKNVQVNPRTLDYEDSEESATAQRDMMLRDAVREDDCLLLDRSFKFNLLTKDEVQPLKFDTVVIRDELTTLKKDAAAAIVTQAVKSLKESGHGIIADYSLPSNDGVRSLCQVLKKEFESELHLDHDYPAMLAAQQAEVCANLSVFGGTYRIVVFKRKTDV